MIAVRTLTDGGQTSPEIARSIAEFLGAAEHTLDLALYDVRLPGPIGHHVADAILAAQGRGVAVRLVYNQDHANPIPVPPPPATQPEVLATLVVPLKSVPG